MLLVVCSVALATPRVDAQRGEKPPLTLPPMRTEKEDPVVLDPATVERIRQEGKRRAEEAFERYYSTAPVHVILEGHEYLVPMNYMTAYGKLPLEMTPRYLDLYMFLPDMSGYNKENYLDPFDKRKITVFVGRSFAGGVPPEQRFASMIDLGLIEREAYDHRYGLAVYAKNIGGDTLFGKRKNNDFILFDCYRYNPQRGVLNPLCQTRYFNREGYYGLYYRFSADHIANWLEIDELINARIMSWRVK